jgi:DNA-binding response OmpR family regulator
MDDSGPTERPLAGHRVLIVEDRYLLAEELISEVERLGGETVGPFRSIAAAQEHLNSAIDIGLLDVNLNGEMVFPLAEQLAARGAAIVFLTGYDEETMPEMWRDRPRLSKPINFRQLREELLKI